MSSRRNALRSVLDEDTIERVESALDADPDAVLIRREFQACTTLGGHIAVTRGIGGKREAALLLAAHRLAGGLR